MFRSSWTYPRLFAALLLLWSASPAPAQDEAASPGQSQPSSSEEAESPVPATPFIIFFDWNETHITQAAAAILDNIAAAFLLAEPAAVVITGQAVRWGSDSYNAELALRRAESTRAYLARRGVPGDRMQIRSFGENRPLVNTSDGVREPQNRRVEIRFDPPSV